MNKFLVIAITFITSIGLSQESLVKVKIKKSKGDMIYLQKAGKTGISSVVDSAKVNFWGTAKLKTNIQEASFYQISKNLKEGIPLILEGEEKIKIKTSKNVVDSYSIKGSKDSELIHEYFGVKNNKEISQDSLVNYAQNFITNNSQSLAIFIALGDIKKDQKKYFTIAEKGIGEKYPNSSYHEILKQYTQKIKALEGPKGPASIGSQAPELNSKGLDGKVITLESLRGKYVLIDFWASWCGPCRRENPTVVKLYNKYKDAGFEVYSVSLDKNKKRWEQAIKKDGLIWPSHVSDLKGWQTQATKLYGFGGIPYTVLIDKEGKIIATKLRGKALENKLADLFKF